MSDLDACLCAIREGDADYIRHFLDEFKFTMKDRLNFYLIEAVEYWQPEIVKMLIEYGVSPNICDQDRSGAHLLHLALYHKHKYYARGADENVKILIDAGADLEYPSNDGYQDTPLMKAVSHADADLIVVLLDKKSNINKQNVEGDTALHIAIDKLMPMNLMDDWGVEIKGAREKAENIIKLLMVRGADCSICNNKGRSPRDIAQWLCGEEIINMMAIGKLTKKAMC